MCDGREHAGVEGGGGVPTWAALILRTALNPFLLWKQVDHLIGLTPTCYQLACGTSLSSSEFHCSNTNINIWGGAFLILALRNYTYSSPYDTLNDEFVAMWPFVTSILFKNHFDSGSNFQMTLNFQALLSSWKIRMFSNNNFSSKELFFFTQLFASCMLTLLKWKYSRPSHRTIRTLGLPKQSHLTKPRVRVI